MEKKKPKQTGLLIRLDKKQINLIREIIQKPIYTPYLKNIIISEHSDKAGSDMIYLKKLPRNMVWQLATDFQNAQLEEYANKNYKMLLEGAQEMLNASHYEHFIIRLNDEEYRGFEKIKTAVENIKKGL